MNEKSGVMPTLTVAASELARQGNQGAVHRMANRMELKTGEMPSLETAASERGSTSGRKSVGKPKGTAVWAKVVQMSGSDKEEIQGTEKCADTKSKICAKLCHQGIGVSYSRRTETPLPRRFWPISSNTIFVKIDPCGIYFANIIVPCRDFGDVVARGYYLRVPLRRQNWEFGAPKG